MGFFEMKAVEYMLFFTKLCLKLNIYFFYAKIRPLFRPPICEGE